MSRQGRVLAVCAVVQLAAAAAQADFVRARGRVLFVDEDGNERPFARVQVRLMDSDSDYDEEIARGFTDEDGRYELSGSAGDSPCAGCGKPDPYVKVVLEDPGRIEVHDIMHFTRNAVLTPTREERGGEIDFGTRTFTDEYPEGRAAILYARAQRAYRRFRELSGDSKVPGNGGEVAVEIPVVLSAGTPYTTWDTIHWPGKSTNFDTFDHEFGHRLRHAADGSVAHFNDDLTWYRYARDHTTNQDTNLGFAFNEGWAHYFRHMLHPDFMSGPMPDPPPPGAPEDEVEGLVARKLIALSDSCPSDGFRHMWDALKGNPGAIHSFAEFRKAFLDRKPPCGANSPSPEPTPRPRRTRPPRDLKIDNEALEGMRTEIAQHVDRLDARRAAQRPRATVRIPAAIREQDRAVVQGLSDRRVRAARAGETAAHAAYRRLVTGLPPLTPESIEDGSYERARARARREFITAVAEPRLRETRAIRRSIANEKARTKDEALRSYLSRLDARQARLESDLAEALKARDSGTSRLPLGALPRSFSGVARGEP